jgi:hypothetical protein
LALLLFRWKILDIKGYYNMPSLPRRGGGGGESERVGGRDKIDMAVIVLC